MPVEGFCDVSKVLLGGVYVLAWAGEIVYVGRSKHLYVRIYQHKYGQWKKQNLRRTVKRMRFDSVEVFPCSEDKAVMLEAELIKQHQPRYNERLLGPKPKTKERLELVIGKARIVLNAPEDEAKSEVKIRRRILVCSGEAEGQPSQVANSPLGFLRRRSFVATGVSDNR